MKFQMSALILALSMSSVSSAQALLEYFAASNPDWVTTTSDQGVIFHAGNIDSAQLCRSNVYAGLAFRGNISAPVTANYVMTWLSCTDDPNTPDVVEGPDFPSYAVSVQSGFPFEEDDADRFGFDKIQTDWEAQGRPRFWSGTLQLVPGDETLPLEVFFLNMSGSILVVEDEEPCPGDLDGDGTIGFSDILAILNSWGACP